MRPNTVTRKRQTRLKRGRYGWYIDGDLCSDKMAELHGAIVGAATQEDRLRLARQILRINPGHIEALTMMGFYAPTQEEKIAYMRQAVEIGNEAWAPGLTGEIQVKWWWELGTRPYIRAIRAYGMALREAGFTEGADRCQATLKEMHERGGEPDAIAYFVRDGAVVEETGIAIGPGIR